jgi:hypothetical protein
LSLILRDDLDFADQLAAALDFSGFKCVIDREGISGGEDWKRRLGNLISEADTVVFVLSPSSARSDTCNWEVEEAARLNKRILPIICRPLEGVSPPARLQDRNYIFFYKEPKAPGSGFGTGLANLVTVLNTDFDWLREHTRYLQRAKEWDTRGRPPNRLLSGDDIAEAKAWATRRPKTAPEPTALQLDFIRASEEEAEARLSEQRKQLAAVAAAQAERETALHQAEEALKQARNAQRKRTAFSIALAVVSLVAVSATLAFYAANQQREFANEQRAISRHEAMLATARLLRDMEVVLNQMAWDPLVAKEFTKALTVADHTHGLFPDDILFEKNRAHALMFMGREDEAKALYVAHKGQSMSETHKELWEEVIAEDFAELRKAGLTHPMMADIEKELGVSR